LLAALVKRQKTRKSSKKQGTKGRETRHQEKITGGSSAEGEGNKKMNNRGDTRQIAKPEK
jgi:hypothetical protein